MRWISSFWIFAFRYFDVRAGVEIGRSCRIGSNRACIATSARKLPPWRWPTVAVAIIHVFAVPAQCQAHHGEGHENVYYPKQTLSPEGRFCRDCLFLDAINALPSLPSAECDTRIKVRLGFLVWFDFHSKLLRVVQHTVGPLFLHCRWITEQPTALIIWLLHRWWEVELLPFYFHCPWPECAW